MTATTWVWMLFFGLDLWMLLPDAYKDLLKEHGVVRDPGPVLLLYLFVAALLSVIQTALLISFVVTYTLHGA